MLGLSTINASLTYDDFLRPRSQVSQNSTDFAGTAAVEKPLHAESACLCYEPRFGFSATCRISRLLRMQSTKEPDGD